MSSTASQRALDYLEQLPGTTFNKLYQQPSTALAIFRRMLPHLAKTIVMAMLYMPTSLALSDLDSWVKSGLQASSARDRAVSVLTSLRIVYETHTENNRAAYKLSDAFASSLRLALTGGGNHKSFGVPNNTADKNPVTVDFLDAYARQQWEAILYYVVGSANAGLSGSVALSAATKELLHRGAFVEVSGRTVNITTAGFTFLLQEINAQIWSLLIVYLEMAPSLQMDPIDVLSFLFTLGSLELGISYSTANLTATQSQMLDDLADYGLVFMRESDRSRYYPTRLATTLTSDAPALPNNSLTSTTTTTTDANPSTTNTLYDVASEKGYIIIETNWRLYAYTNSPLLISILSLFSQLHTRYANLVTAKITKVSIQSAIAQGITANQIIEYLQTHAHPILRRQTPILPPTVVDQIRLWQREGERMETTQGFMIRDVGTADDYDRAVKYAENLGVLTAQFREKGSFFVTRMDQMQVYFRSQAQRKKDQVQAAQAKASSKANGNATPSGSK